jgi:hypothetical protein
MVQLLNLLNSVTIMERREFAKKSVLLSSGLVALGLQSNKTLLSAKTLKPSIPINDAKKIFRQKGACSNTFCFLLNREFGNNDENYERSTDLLAGGLAQSGHQCGMLWGSSLAIGTEAYRQCGNCSKAIGASTAATQSTMQSFVQRTGTANCREVTGCDFNSKWDTMRYMVKVIVGGMDNMVCFKLAESWMPEAIKAASDGLTLATTYTKTPVSCASEVVKRLGGSDQEIAMVGGFAGGLGLSGNACGALAASIWMNMLKWHRKNPDKKAKYFNNPVAKRVLKAFYDETGKEILCQKICGQTFKNIDDHTKFLNSGGCNKLIKVLSQA